MLSRIILVISIVMICLVVVLVSFPTQIGIRLGKLTDSNNLTKISSDTIDIDTEIMRRLQRIGSYRSSDFVKKNNTLRD
jgi:hypothetical protein